MDGERRVVARNRHSFESCAIAPQVPIYTRVTIDWHGMAIFGLVALALLLVLMRLLLRG